MYSDELPVEKTVIVNGKTLTESEFRTKREEVEKKPGVKIVEVSPGVYKIRLKG